MLQYLSCGKERKSQAVRGTCWELVTIYTQFGFTDCKSSLNCRFSSLFSPLDVPRNFAFYWKPSGECSLFACPTSFLSSFHVCLGHEIALQVSPCWWLIMELLLSIYFPPLLILSSKLTISFSPVILHYSPLCINLLSFKTQSASLLHCKTVFMGAVGGINMKLVYNM